MKEDNRKIKLLLVVINNKNYGDPVIADCTEYLIRKALGKKAKEYKIIRYSFYSDDVGQIKYVDSVIFAGGGLIKFKKELFYKRVADIINEAEKYNVPVFFNAVGVEGYDESDERCMMLVESLKSRCIKEITVRDDIDLLRSKYTKGTDIYTKSVIDPAIWTPKVYGVSRDSNSDVIGLGIARDMIFIDYELAKFDRQYMLDFWKETALSLEAKGLKWKIFTNGLDSDERFAEDVLAYIGHGEKYSQPENAVKLVKNISTFKAVIAIRMHSNIIAYSLGIPSVGLVWNDKLKMWGEKIGYPERFLEGDSLTAENAVSTLTKAIKEGSRKPGYFQKRSGYYELRDFLKKQVTHISECTENIDFSDRIMATALGGAEYRYRNINCVANLKNVLAKGVKTVEVDVRMTSDGKLVCVNGWSEDTFKKLGIEYKKELSKGLKFDEFMTLDYYGKYPTASFKDFVFAMNEHRDVKVFIDVGLPPKRALESLFENIAKSLKHFGVDSSRIIIRLQRKNDVDLWKQQGYNCEIAYFLPEIKDEKERAEVYEEIISYCKSENIDIISLRNTTYTYDTAKLLNEKGMKPCIFSYVKPCDIIEAAKKGAYLIASSYFFSDYISELVGE